MVESQSRGGWALTVFAAVAASAALGFAALYLMRPNAGELGAIKVQITDDAGKAGNTVHITVVEAPFLQKEPVSPGNSFSGSVQFPQPYHIPPHLKLASASGKRLYEVLTVNEYGFTWTAKPLPDDIRDDGKKEADILERVLGTGGLQLAQLRGQLKLSIVFEDFTWEAKGVRMPLGNLPPRTHTQDGKFYTLAGQEGPVTFALPYASPPSLEFTGYRSSIVITEVTATGFKWRNPNKDKPGYEGEVQWTAKGILASEKK